VEKHHEVGSDGDQNSGSPSIAVLIPCHNEELTIAQVVTEFRRELPDADIYVYDNNSSDGTLARAAEAGAIVRQERRQGKGYVVQSMFQQVDADYYVMVDGDGTYPSKMVHQLLDPVMRGQAAMVVGSRLHRESVSEFKRANRFGNHVFQAMLNSFFEVALTDILSGYRAFSRAFVKSVPLFCGGFEIETELTIKALEKRYRIAEVPVSLTSRPEGSYSKISVISDGFLILRTIFAFLRDYKPLAFFSVAGSLLILAGLVPGIVVIVEFIETRQILHMPSTVLAVGLVLSGMLLLMVALILHTIVRRFQEIDHQMQALRRRQPDIQDPSDRT